MSTGYDILQTVCNRKYLLLFCINHYYFSFIIQLFPSMEIFCYCSGEKCEGLLAFSIYSNGMKLLSYKRAKSSDTMHCLHGIRVISTQWVVLGHTFQIYKSLPIRNMFAVSEVNRMNLTSRSSITYKLVFFFFEMFTYSSFRNIIT